MTRQVVIDIEPPKGRSESYAQADRNLGRVSVQLPTGEMISSGEYRVELALSRDAMIGLATTLLRLAHQDPNNTVFRHARPIEEGLASAYLGFYLAPNSCEIIVAEQDLGTVAAQIEALESELSGEGQ